MIKIHIKYKILAMIKENKFNWMIKKRLHKNMKYNLIKSLIINQIKL
jgi:hypothetical protein